MAYDFKTYMLDVATRLKDIGHTETTQRFFEVSNITQMDGLFAKLSKAAGTLLIPQINPEGIIGDPSNSDNFRDECYHIFYIAKHVTNFNNAEEINAAKQHCKRVGFKVFSKMRKEKAQGNSSLQFLRFTRVPYQAIGPFANGWYGVMFSFRVDEHAASLNYDANDWL